jgi:hypothetical protein
MQLGPNDSSGETNETTNRKSGGMRKKIYKNAVLGGNYLGFVFTFHGEKTASIEGFSCCISFFFI